jgi:hypothetical protein
MADKKTVADLLEDEIKAFNCDPLVHPLDWNKVFTDPTPISILNCISAGGAWYPLRRSFGLLSSLTRFPSIEKIAAT